MRQQWRSQLFGMGGGDPKCTYWKKKDSLHVTYMRERAKRASASDTYIFSGLKILVTDIHIVPLCALNKPHYAYKHWHWENLLICERAWKIFAFSRSWHDYRLTCASKFPNAPIKLRKASLLPPPPINASLLLFFSVCTIIMLCFLSVHLGVLPPNTQKLATLLLATPKCTDRKEIHNL